MSSLPRSMDVTPHAVTEVFLNFSRAKSTVVTPATTGSPGEEDLVRGTKRTRRIFGAVENNPKGPMALRRWSQRESLPRLEWVSPAGTAAYAPFTPSHDG